VNAQFVFSRNRVPLVVLTVSRQPGDNFRVAASCATNMLSALTVTNSFGAPYVGGNNAPVAGFNGKITELLTVWRRLHVEVDSMAAVPTSGAEINTVSGLLTNITGAAGFGATKVIANINFRLGLGDNSPNLDTSMVGTGRFENGQATIGVGQFITPNLMGNGDWRVLTKPGDRFSIPCQLTKGTNILAARIVSMTQGFPRSLFGVNTNLVNRAWDGGIINVAGKDYSIKRNTITLVEVNQANVTLPFVLHDDDDDSLLPRFPDTAAVVAAMRVAYVFPFTSTDNSAVAFKLNIPYDYDAHRDAQDWNTKSDNADDYWVAYVLSCFQPGKWYAGGGGLGDLDPRWEDSIYGVTAGPLGQYGGCLIFVESHQSHEGTANPSLQEQDTVVHELGHAVGGRALPPGADPENSTGGGVSAGGKYSSTYVDYIRTSTRPFP